MRAHAGRAHPAQDQVGRCAMLRGEEEARQMLWRFGDRAELVDPADDLLAQREILRPAAAAFISLMIFQ